MVFTCFTSDIWYTCTGFVDKGSCFNIVFFLSFLSFKLDQISGEKYLHCVYSSFIFLVYAKSLH